VYHGGAIVYTNEEKTRSCGVPKETIEQFGAVSWQVVEALARGIRDRVGTTYGIAITGIAGPGGATESKPVGRVCIGIAHPEGVDVAVYDFKPTEPSHGAGTFSDLIHTLDRHTIRELNVEKALAMLEKRILYNADL
jgi:nicotinamide-nucleotide amidase